MPVTLQRGVSPPKRWNLSEQLSLAFEKKRYVDYELICQGVRIPVHKAIVCTQSDAIAAAQSWANFDCSRSYNFLDDDLALVERLVEAFYTGLYREEVIDGEFSDEPINTIQLHVRMYLLADKYQCDGVKELAADRYGVEIRKTAQYFDFFAAIPEIFQDCSVLRELQELAVDRAKKILATPSQRSERYALYKEALEKAPSFGRHLLDGFVRAPRGWSEEGSPTKRQRSA